ncbi:CD1375 family protein [Zhenhengia yiwuensis]|uniref:CD1375 family protein n=1 Tax=Zhenhengia yiwuensis TaxID=2763666 RepID=UPI002A74C7DB|nr:CD1375 family protein [Zhenhengia yiwuensis]MDY3366755.1 CD1375 family protein [Zhenhengia yiwuensis]
MLSSARIRAYARTMDAGLRTIEEVQEDYRVAVYIELIARYDWSLEEVDERYIEQIKKELEIIE